MLTKDFDSLENILDAIEKIEKYSRPLKNADELFEDEKTFAAVSKQHPRTYDIHSE